MAMKKISVVEQSLLSVSIYINNFKRAIEELIYNSLDATSSSIAIRVDIEDGFIQVLDNGIGISKDNFSLLGLKYATSKYIDKTTLKSAPDKYGFRGLCLASIIDIAKNVTITSRNENSDDTWLKIFINGNETEICKTISRPSKGTTVDIKGFLYNLNIQRQSIDPHNELHNIKTALQQLSLVHTNVSISLRDNSKNDIIFQIHKNRNMYNTLWSLFQINEKFYQEFQVEKNEYKVKAFIGKTSVDSNKTYQWIYLNGKFINKSTIHRKLKETFSMFPKTMNNNKTNKHGNEDEKNIFYGNNLSYFVFLSCPNYDFNITYNAEEVLVEFKDWKEINKLIEKLVLFYCGGVSSMSQSRNPEKIQCKEKQTTTRTEIKEIIERILSNKNKQPRISQLQNGVKGKILRCQKKRRGIMKKTLSKCVENIELYQVAQLPKNDMWNLNTVINSKTKNDNQIVPENKTKNILKTEGEEIIKPKNIWRKSENVYCDNLLIKKFKAQTKAAKKQYEHLSRKVKKMKDKCNIFKENALHNNINSKIKSKNVHEKLDAMSLHNHSNNIEKKIYTKNFKTVKSSHDLLKTVLNKEYNMTAVLPENENDYFNQYEIKTNYNGHETSIPIATYNSHVYKFEDKNRTNLNNFISDASCNNFRMYKQPFLSMSNKKEIKRTNLGKNNKGCSKPKSTNNFLHLFNQELKEFSYTIETNNSCETVNCRSEVFNANITQNIIKTDSDRNIKPTYYSNFKSFNFDNTYTLENFKSSTYSNPLNINKTFLFRKLSIQSNSSNYFEEIQPSDVRDYVDNEIKNGEKENTTSKDESPNRNITFHGIEPINFCRAVLSNSNELNDFEDEFKNSFVENSISHKHISKNMISNSLKHKLNNFENVLNVSTCQTSEIVYNKCNNEEILPIKFGNTRQNIREKSKNQETSLCELNNIKIVNSDKSCDFKLRSRHRFMPKGMSPITKNKYLRSASYSFNGDKVYFKDMIYQKFANDVLINSEIFEPEVQNIKKVFSKDIEKFNSEVTKKNADLTFDPMSLRKAKVLGQIDRKFIATVLNGRSSHCDKISEFLVLFDQHAVDERIRLESNLKDYLQGSIWKSIDLDPVSLILSKDDYFYLLQHKEKLAKFGLQWAFKSDNEILLNAIPKAILGQHPRQVELAIKAVKGLIAEQIEAIKSLRGNISLFPKSIMDLVFSEACRYAIKFGDKLATRDCVSMIESLSYCQTPFQCAHGRPVMAVIMELTNNRRSYTVDSTKIKKFTSIQQRSE